ncbi:NAD(P)H-hydrate epimerase [Gemmiger sp. An194]|uniref:NAD(P)H-hydrate epimerase n=1 Tax=Gemmiger sp. An194 TaxID=1965582 RepID=UPI000B376DF3|nr:NAD(P)H-hydrate epimerase [Gemmiger sp. An194]OUP25161.1 NAD(P)H-hydrate epimerase [Gemmiger sp. An194]
MSEVTAAEMKRMEQQADAAGLSYRQMMENAGAAAAALALRAWPGAKSAVVFCGKGNNGGDGFVAARHLANAGLAVRLYLVEGEPVTTDAIYNCGLAREMGLPVLAADALDEPEQADFLQNADIILDGVYGTGFHGTLRPEGLAAARRMNEAPGRVLALDLPSGLEADSGTAAEGAVQADLTVTFHAAKPCHRLAAAQCGKVEVADIGIGTALQL